MIKNGFNDYLIRFIIRLTFFHQFPTLTDWIDKKVWDFGKKDLQKVFF